MPEEDKDKKLEKILVGVQGIGQCILTPVIYGISGVAISFGDDMIKNTRHYDLFDKIWHYAGYPLMIGGGIGVLASAAIGLVGVINIGYSLKE